MFPASTEHSRRLGLNRYPRPSAAKPLLFPPPTQRLFARLCEKKTALRYDRPVTPAPFAVHAEELEGGIRVFMVRGELDMNTAPELEGELEEALAQEGASIMLDLSECEFIDSTGIALIVRAWQRLDGNGGGGRLVLCCFRPQVERLLKITGVASSISMHEDREAALAELRG